MKRLRLSRGHYEVCEPTNQILTQRREGCAVEDGNQNLGESKVKLGRICGYQSKAGQL